jgi:hypothetical protein
MTWLPYKIDTQTQDNFGFIDQMADKFKNRTLAYIRTSGEGRNQLFHVHE